MYAVTPNLQWTTGNVNYTPDVSALVIQLDNGDTIKGDVNKTSCTEINWEIPIATWIKIPNVKNVHVVFMNHLDVGYNGIPKTGFIGNVLNVYFQEYFPRAIRLGMEMEKVDPDSGFIYTTHPWLLNLYLNCPLNFTLNGIQLYCPSNDEIQVMTAAILAGNIVWQAGPMNMQIELMNEQVLQASMQLAKELDGIYNRQTLVLSQRDVPGLTAGAIHTLVKDFGIQGVSVGVNPGSSPPAVPKLFEWKLHEESTESVIAMWNPGGYPTNPGNSLSNAGGISLMDSVVSESDGQALVFAFRTDNSGPPTSLEEIQSVYDILKQQFDGAHVFASTMDNFVKSVNKESLPVVVGEIGDTWIQGIASDPRKMAMYRYGAHALELCSQDPQSQCVLDSVARNYLRFLTKLPEHTWGLPNVYDNVNWTNTAFQGAKIGDNYQNCKNSWKEQRVFFNITRDLSRQTKNPFSDWLEKLLSSSTLDPYPSSLENLIHVDASKTFNLDQFGIPVNLGFGKDGSIVSMTGKDSEGNVIIFADKQHPIGTFTYHTYNETDYAFVNSEYGYYGNAGYDKPNVTDNAHPNSSISHYLLKDVYQSKTDPEFCLALQPPTSQLHLYYGAPKMVWSCIEFTANQNKSLLPLEVTFKVSLIDKTPTRLPEATMFSFTPPLQSTAEQSQWKHQLFKVQPLRQTSEIPTGGITLDSIVKNGSFYQHALEDVYLIDGDEKMYIHLNSIEVPLVCPIFDATKGFRTPNPLPILSRPEETAKLLGFAFNIHNNVWNTNYPLWYPFAEGDQNFRANFHLHWQKEKM